MIPLTLEEIADIVGGRVVDADADRRSSPARRSSTAGLRKPAGSSSPSTGEHVDGHDYAPAAVEGGAAAVLGSRATGVPDGARRPTRSAHCRSWPGQVLAPAARARGNGLRVVAITGSQGKTIGQGHARACPGRLRHHRRHGGFVQQRARPAADGAARRRPRRASSCSRWARAGSATSPSCARSRHPTSRWCSTSARHTSASSARRSRSRWPRASWSRRSDLMAPPCSTPTTRSSRRWPLAPSARTVTFGRSAAADVRLDDVEVDDLGRPSFALVTGRRRAHVSLRLAGRAPGAQRRGDGGGRGRGRRALRWTCRRQPARRSTGSPGGAWRSTSAPTGWSWSTTPTTPTPTRCARRSRRWPGWADAGGRRTVAVLGEMRELGAAADEEHRAVGAPRPRPRHRRRRGRRTRRAAACTTLSSRPAATTDDAPRRDRRRGGRLVARECRGPRRRPRQGVAWRATRAGRRQAHRGRDWPDGCQTERRPRVESDPAGRWALADLHAGRHPLRDPGALRTRLRPADPRRRPDHPPHQARHPHDGRPGDRAVLGARLLPRHASSPATRPARRRCCCSSCSSGSGTVGFLDDYIKISRQRSLGLRSRAKFIGQTFVALVFGWLATLAVAGGRQRCRRRPGTRSPSSATRATSLCR